MIIDMAALGGCDSKEVELTFFNDAPITATRTNLEITGDHGFGWYGHVIDTPESQVVLVANKDALSGVIRLPGVTYKIRPMGDGLHLLREIYAGSTPVMESTGLVKRYLYRIAHRGGQWWCHDNRNSG